MRATTLAILHAEPEEEDDLGVRILVPGVQWLDAASISNKEVDPFLLIRSLSLVVGTRDGFKHTKSA